MRLLTESKIRELLKTTNLKHSRELVIEKNTIITPAAKSYINEKKIKLIEDAMKIQPYQQEITVIKEPLVEDYFVDAKLLLITSKVEKLIVQAVILQKECLNNQKLLAKIDMIISTLKQLRNFLANEEELVIDKELIDNFYSENINNLAQDKADNYPTYTDNYLTLRLFEFYIDVKTVSYEVMEKDERLHSYAWQKYLQWIIDSCLVVYLMEKGKGGMS
ncbi:hypothetical protein ACF3NG_01370 [Aerococcaceae bacterium WGS1372]